MGVTTEQLKQLQENIPYKYRLQSAKNGRATIVSYIDSRQAAQRLDDVLGAENWQDNYELLDKSVVASVSILVGRADGEEWVTKKDLGTESNTDAEKGEISDAFKRACVKWGLGRFLYKLGIITLKTATHTNGKEYPATDDSKILWTVDELTEYCEKVAESGDLDRTKYGVKALAGATVTPQPVKKVTPTAKATTTEKSKPSTQITGSAIQPNTNFDKTEVKGQPTEGSASDESARRAKALELFNKLDAATVLKSTIKSGYKFTSVQEFVKEAPIDKVLEMYGQLTAK
jgi:Uncharacterized protein conserved in bacteria